MADVDNCEALKVFFFFTWLVRAPVSGGVGAVEMTLPIRVAPHKQARGLGTALYQLLLAEILLVPHNHLTVGLCTVGHVKESAERISLVSFVISTQG